MKLSKALMTLALLALMLPGLIACGAKQEQTQEEDLLEASMAAMDEIESYRMQMSMIMDMSIAGESLNTTTHAQGAVINEPLAMEMQMNMDMGDMGGADVLMYLEKAEDGTDLVYMSIDGGASWTRQEGVSAESAETYNVKDNMDLYLKSAENFQKAGEETVNDIQTVRYDGFISQEAMNQVMETSGLQEQLGIPVVVLNGDLDQSAAAFRFLGEILGEEEQAEALATYAEDTLAWLETAVASVPEDAKVTVYYGNGETSLNTAPAGSSHAQVLDMVGAINVANLEAGSGSRIDVSKEQVLEWNPEVVILNGEPKEDFTANAAVEAFISDPDYATVGAVQNNQVYGSPKTPFSWIDRPPGPNRLICLRWAFSVIYPDYADYDMDTVTREFYQLFYHMDLTDEQMELLMTA